MVCCRTERVILAAVSTLKTANTTSAKSSRVTEVPMWQSRRLMVRFDRQESAKGGVDVRHNSWVQPPHAHQHSPFRRTQATVLSSQSKGVGASCRPHGAGLPVPLV